MKPKSYYEAMRQISAGTTLLNALRDMYKDAVITGRQRQFSKVAHSIIDLLELDETPVDDEQTNNEAAVKDEVAK